MIDKDLNLKEQNVTANSTNKQEFLEDPLDSRQMRASEIQPLAMHYFKKHNIIIIKNGASSLGKNFIEKQQEKILNEFEEEITPFKNEDNKYGNYIKRGFNYDSFTLHGWIIGEENTLYLKNLLHEFLTPSMNVFKPGLSGTDFEKINKILREDPHAKDIMDKEIDSFSQYLIQKKKLNIQNACLSHEEAWQEIRALQQNIKNDQSIGYLYTNGVNQGREHFEVVLITKNEVIKPLNWPDMVEKEISGKQGQLLSETRIKSSNILTKPKQVSPPHPQADKTACGTLGFLYLKEFLKDDSRQLKSFTLSFSIFDGSNQSEFFFPSPQILRYSQSNTYNKIICAMLEDSNTPQSVQKFKVVTLKKLLEDSIQKAKECADIKTVEKNTKILENLPQYREKWMAVYNVMMQKREAMQGEDNVNEYLAYSTQRLSDHASVFKENTKSISLNSLEELLANTTLEAETVSSPSPRTII